MTNEGIYNFQQPDEEVVLDPSTLNLYELTLVLSMSGWMVATGMVEDGNISFFMKNMGGAGHRSADVLLEELGLRDEEGEIIEGYSVEDAEDGLELQYNGVPNLKFADVAHRLFELSPANQKRFETGRPPVKKGLIHRLLGKIGLGQSDKDLR